MRFTPIPFFLLTALVGFAPALLLAVPIDANLSAARAALDSGDPASAAERLAEALSARPGDIEARLLFAEALLRAGRPAEAEASLLVLLSGEQVSAEVAPPYLRALLDQGKYAQVLDVTGADSPVVRAGDAAEILCFRTEALMGQGLYAVAEGVLDRARSNGGADLSVGTLAAKLAILQGQYDSAQATLRALSPSHPDAWELAAAQGDLAFAEQRFDAADRHYSLALTLRMGDWQLLYRRALARLETGDLAAAERDVARIRPALKRFSGLRYFDGRRALINGDAEAAVALLRTFVEESPTDVSGRFHLGSALFEAERHSEAQDILAAVLRVDPENLAAMLLLARSFLASDKPEAAGAVIAPVLSRADVPAAFLDVQRRVYLAQGRRRDAAALVAQAEEVLEGTLQGRMLEAQRLLGELDGEGAREILTRLVAEHPDYASAHTLLVQSYLADGDLEAAAGAASEQSQADPDSASGYVNQAFVASLRRQPDVARLLLEQAVRVEPQDIQSRLALAALELKQGSIEAARSVLEPQLAVDPTNTRLVLAAGVIERKAGESGRFIEALSTALQANPSALTLRLELARSLLEQDKPHDALNLLQSAPGDQQSEIQLIRLSLQALKATGQQAAVGAVLREISNITPNDPLVRYQLALWSAQMSDLPTAEQHLLDGVRVDETDRLLPQVIGPLLDRHTTDRNRQDLLEKLLDARPGHPGVLLSLAMFSRKRADHDASVEAYTALTERFPERIDYRVGLGDALIRAGLIDDARLELAKISEAFPREVAARMLLAKIFLLKEAPQSAIVTYREVLEIDDQNVTALNNLAMLLKDEFPYEAMDYARSALELAPDDVDVLDTLGATMLVAGDHSSAVVVLRRAYESSDAKPSVALRLAEAYAKAGAVGRAKDLLQTLATASREEQRRAEQLYRSLGDP